MNAKQPMLLKVKVNDFEDVKLKNSSLNKRDDSCWRVLDEVELVEVEINWDEFSKENNSQLIAKDYIRALFKVPHQDNGIIFCRKGTMKYHLDHLKVFLNLSKKLFPDKILSKLILEDVLHIARTLMIKKDGTLYGRGKGEGLTTILTRLKSFYDCGKVVEGINFEIPIDLKKYLFRGLFSNEKEYQNWGNGGSWDKLPVHIAILFLSDMLEVINNSPTDFLIEYFKFQRSKESVNALDALGHKSRLAQIMRFRETKNSEKKYHLRFNDERLIKKLTNLSNIFIKAGYTSKTLPSKNDMRRMCKNIYDSSLVIVTILSGIRISEVASLKVSSFFNDGSGNNFFASNITKTHDGIKINRSISGEVLKVITLCMEISYIDKSDKSPFVPAYTSGFSYPNRGEQHTCKFNFNKQTLGNKIMVTYKNWLESQSDEIQDIAPESISPHCLRHVFAAIALRRFDGDICEKLRRHFGHSYGSGFIQAYIKDKQNEDIQIAIEKEYIREIVGKIARGNEEYYGPVASRIREYISKDYRFCNIDELDDAIEELASKFEHIVPHEYGICLPNNLEMAKAQCMDRKTGEAMIWENSSVKNCTHCVHRLTHKSQAESIIRIAISHQNFIDQSPFSSLTKLSKKIVKQCESVIKEMGISLKRAKDE